MKDKLLIAHFKNYVASKIFLWMGLTDTRKIDFIEHAFTRDLAFRIEVRGKVIGHFTIEEYQQYFYMMRGSNKRINNMIKQRMISHLDALSL